MDTLKSVGVWIILKINVPNACYFFWKICGKNYNSVIVPTLWEIMCVMHLTRNWWSRSGRVCFTHFQNLLRVFSWLFIEISELLSHLGQNQANPLRVGSSHRWFFVFVAIFVSGFWFLVFYDMQVMQPSSGSALRTQNPFWACWRVEFCLETDSRYLKDTGVNKPWQLLGIPFAITPPSLYDWNIIAEEQYRHPRIHSNSSAAVGVSCSWRPLRRWASSLMATHLVRRSEGGVVKGGCESLWSVLKPWLQISKWRVKRPHQSRDLRIRFRMPFKRGYDANRRDTPRAVALPPAQPPPAQPPIRQPNTFTAAWSRAVSSSSLRPQGARFPGSVYARALATWCGVRAVCSWLS